MHMLLRASALLLFLPLLLVCTSVSAAGLTEASVATSLAPAPGVADSQPAVAGAVAAQLALGLEAQGRNATLKWLEAAELGNETAQFRVGVMYAFGRGGLPRDDARAILHYYFSSLSGHVPALMALGSRHHRGDGVPQKCRTSVAYWERAADTLVRGVERGEDMEPFVNQERLPVPDEAKPEARAHGDEDVVDYYHNIATKGDLSAMVMLGAVCCRGSRCWSGR
jgi:hypothetical protein